MLTRFIVRPDVVECDLDGGKALLNLATSQYYKVNSTGAEAFARLTKAASLDEVVDHMCQAFEVSSEDCRADIAALIQQFEEAELVERAP